MEKIKPKTKLSKEEKYELEDKDYLFIRAVQQLTKEIEKLRLK